MLSQEEKAALFIDAINKDAQKMCREIEKETKKFYAAQTQKLEEAAKNELAQKLAYAQKDIMSELNRKTAQEKSRHKHELYERRRELTDGVLDKAKNRLVEFTLSGEYEGFLENSIGNIMSVLKNDVVLYVKPEDISSASAAASKGGFSCRIEEDTSIKIGGVRGESESEKKIADDTLDQRLICQKEWFLRHVSKELNI